MTVRDNKHWTDEEIEYLEDSWGKIRLTSMIKKLKRSEISITRKACRLGLSDMNSHSDQYSMFQVSQLLKVSPETVKKWVNKHGLKGKYVALRNDKRTVIKHNSLMSWLKNNQELWNADNLELYALGEEPEWLQHKRRNNTIVVKGWTKLQDRQLIEYYNLGYKHKELSEMFKKSMNSVRNRIYKLRCEGKISLAKYDPWTTKETQAMLELEKQGITDKAIAERLNREESQIFLKRQNLKNAGMYKGIKLDKRIS